jgi:hypothetical protein
LEANHSDLGKYFSAIGSEVEGIIHPALHMNKRARHVEAELRRRSERWLHVVKKHLKRFDPTEVSEQHPDDTDLRRRRAPFAFGDVPALKLRLGATAWRSLGIDDKPRG